MIAHYLKIAWRNLLKYRTQSIISIIGLAVGLFSFTVCFYCSRFIESRDHCFINHERIAELHLYDPIIGHYFLVLLLRCRTIYVAGLTSLKLCRLCPTQESALSTLK